jgi:hypothetical protein
MMNGSPSVVFDGDGFWIFRKPKTPYPASRFSQKCLKAAANKGVRHTASTHAPREATDYIAKLS